MTIILKQIIENTIILYCMSIYGSIVLGSKLYILKLWHTLRKLVCQVIYHVKLMYTQVMSQVWL